VNDFFLDTSLLLTKIVAPLFLSNGSDFLKLIIQITLFALTLQALAPVFQLLTTEQVTICIFDEIDEDEMDEKEKSGLEELNSDRYPSITTKIVTQGDASYNLQPLSNYATCQLRCCDGHSGMPDVPPEV
jgi:hypothetical protein